MTESIDEHDVTQAEIDELFDTLATLKHECEETLNRSAAFEVKYREMISGRLALVEERQAELAALLIGQRDRVADARAAEAARVAAHLTPKERWLSMVKRIHPRSLDDEDYDAREELTKRVNDAWDRRDMPALDLLEAEIDRLTAKDAEQGERQEILARARRRFVQAIAECRALLAELHGRALWQLLVRVEEASEEGRDLLQEQADELDKLAESLDEEIRAFTPNERANETGI